MKDPEKEILKELQEASDLKHEEAVKEANRKLCDFYKKKYTETKEHLEQIQDVGKVVLGRTYLSIKAHPDCTEDSEFADVLDSIEQLDDLLK